MKCNISQAEPSQVSSLSELAFRSKAYWGYSSEFMEMCRNELTYSLDEIENNACYLALENNKIIGFYLLKHVNNVTCELEAMFVEPTAIGNGYGRKLTDHAKLLAQEKGYKKIIVQGDPNAVEFYLVMGAVQTGFSESQSISDRFLPMFEFQL